MPKPARFLYGLILGVSLGIIWARLFGAAHRSPHHAARGHPHGGARHAVLIASSDERELEEATAR